MDDSWRHRVARKCATMAVHVDLGGHVQERCANGKRIKEVPLDHQLDDYLLETVFVQQPEPLKDALMQSLTCKYYSSAATSVCPSCGTKPRLERAMPRAVRPFHSRFMFVVLLFMVSTPISLSSMCVPRCASCCHGNEHFFVPNTNAFFSVDVGSYSVPAVVDWNADGILDLIVGNEAGRLFFYDNVNGALVQRTGNENPFHAVDVGGHAVPAFTDWDRDGDMDLVVGSQNGTLRYYERVYAQCEQVNPSCIVERVGSSNPFRDVGLGAEFSAPTFADWDGDGDPDLVLGSSSWMIQYFEQTSPGVLVLRWFASNHHFLHIESHRAIPTIYDVDGDGYSDIIIGGKHFQRPFNRLLFYRRTDANTLVAPETGQHPFTGITLPSHPAPVVVDWDGDGNPDVIVGGLTGELSYYTLEKANALVERIGVSVNPLYALTTETGSTIGSIAALSFVDWDGDGDQDAVVATQNGVLWYVEQSSSTSFNLRRGRENPFDVDVGGSRYLHPTVLDWDQDGDVDLVLGTDRGVLRYYEQQPDRSFMFREGPGLDPFHGLQVPAGSAMHQAFADWDCDGDIDVLISSSVTLSYFENDGGNFVGRSQAPPSELNAQTHYHTYYYYYSYVRYVASDDIDGECDMTNLFLCLSRAHGGNFTLPVRPSFVDWDGDGDDDLVLTDAFGHAAVFERAATACSSDKLLINTIQLNHSFGFQAALTFADWDSDGDPDVFAGTRNGDFGYWARDFCEVPTPCSDNGVCHGITGVCRCATGYESADCSHCAPGFYGTDNRPSGRDCVACAGDGGNVCANRGVCVDDVYSKNADGLSLTQKLYANGNGTCICTESVFYGEDSVGRKTCAQGMCPAGMEENEEKGIGKCEECPPGTSSTEGGPCNTCPAGRFAIEGQGVGACFPCEEGRYASTGSSVCSRCQSGYIPSAAQDQCLICPANTKAQPGDVGCSVCPDGHISDAGSAACSYNIGIVFLWCVLWFFVEIVIIAVFHRPRRRFFRLRLENRYQESWVCFCQLMLMVAALAVWQVVMWMAFLKDNVEADVFVKVTVMIFALGVSSILGIVNLPRLLSAALSYHQGKVLKIRTTFKRSASKFGETGRLIQSNSSLVRSEETLDVSDRIQGLHVELYQEFAKASCCPNEVKALAHVAACEILFQEMQTAAQELASYEDQDLRAVARAYQGVYQRWAYVSGIQDFMAEDYAGCQPQEQSPSMEVGADGTLRKTRQEDEHNWRDENLVCLQFMEINASWAKPSFDSLVRKAVKILNAADELADVRHYYKGVEGSEFNQPFLSTFYTLKAPWREDPMADTCGRYANLILGPIKLASSAERKVASMYQEHIDGDYGQYCKPTALYVQDFLRLTVSFVDPFFLGIFFAMLKSLEVTTPGFRIVRVKNKHNVTKLSGSPSVLINAELCTVTGRQVCELQLYLDDFLALKMAAHKTYEVTRATHFTELLKPVYKPSLELVDPAKPWEQHPHRGSVPEAWPSHTGGGPQSTARDESAKAHAKPSTGVIPNGDPAR